MSFTSLKKLIVISKILELKFLKDHLTNERQCCFPYKPLVQKELRNETMTEKK